VLDSKGSSILSVVSEIVPKFAGVGGQT